jgi:hypothetical protein
MQTMVIRVVELTGYGTVRHVWVSVPFIPCLLDGKKYREPDDVPKPESRDFRRMHPRAPTLRMMVKIARQCDSAEQLGLELRKRYGRKPSDHEIAESDREIDRLLAQDRQPG